MKGKILACLIDSLPHGISVLLGNDVSVGTELLEIGFGTRAQSRLTAHVDTGQYTGRGRGSSR